MERNRCRIFKTNALYTKYVKNSYNSTRRQKRKSEKVFNRNFTKKDL